MKKIRIWPVVLAGVLLIVAVLGWWFASLPDYNTPEKRQEFLSEYEVVDEVYLGDYIICVLGANDGSGDNGIAIFQYTPFRVKRGSILFGTPSHHRKILTVDGVDYMILTCPQPELSHAMIYLAVDIPFEYEELGPFDMDGSHILIVPWQDDWEYGYTTFYDIYGNEY